MTASQDISSISPETRLPLRIRLRPPAAGAHLGGAWWPQSRDLQTEAADLIDHLPDIGHVNRLLFSRPDWDDGVVDGRGARRIRARRGPVKVGSFPSDDTQMMVLVLSDGRRLSLEVIASDTDPGEARRRLDAAAAPSTEQTAAESERWDGEDPAF